MDGSQYTGEDLCYKRWLKNHNANKIQFDPGEFKCMSNHIRMVYFRNPYLFNDWRIDELRNLIDKLLKNERKVFLIG